MYTDEESEGMQKALIKILTKRNTKVYLISLTLLFLAQFIPIIMLNFVPNEEPLSKWYQRSGSIMLLFVLMAEIYAVKLKKMTTGGDIDNFIMTVQAFRFLKENKILQICIFSTAFEATIIWGYGDLLF